MTVQETATFLRISRSSAYEGIATGAIPSITIGRRKLVPTAELRRLVGIADGPKEAA